MTQKTRPFQLLEENPEGKWLKPFLSQLWPHIGMHSQGCTLLNLHVSREMHDALAFTRFGEGTDDNCFKALLNAIKGQLNADARVTVDLRPFDSTQVIVLVYDPLLAAGVPRKLNRTTVIELDPAARAADDS